MSICPPDPWDEVRTPLADVPVISPLEVTCTFALAPKLTNCTPYVPVMGEALTSVNVPEPEMEMPMPLAAETLKPGRSQQT